VEQFDTVMAKDPKAFASAANGQELAQVYFEDQHGLRMAMNRLTRDDPARRYSPNEAGTALGCVSQTCVGHHFVQVPKPEVDDIDTTPSCSHRLALPFRNRIQAYCWL
jgi:hypothetical protein